jgi:hypothetical protein
LKIGIYIPLSAEAALPVPSGRRSGFQTEHLDTSTGRLMKLQPGLYHARVIIYKERMRGDIIADVVEMIFRHLSVAIDQQFAVVAFGQRVFGDSFVR